VQRAVNLSLRPEHLKRYKDFARLLFKYGRRDLVARAGLNELLPQEAEEDEARIPEARELARDVEKLGPTYIKLAQLLSTRPDIIPPVYAEALARLQDNVAPFSFGEVEKILTEELGVRLSKAFVTIGNNLKEIPEIVIPRPVLDYSSSRVLTMEFVPGTKITALSPLAKMELDGEQLADALFRAYLKQMLRDGLFHADPHPGNVFLVDRKIALIDLGMVARVRPALQ